MLWRDAHQLACSRACTCRASSSAAHCASAASATRRPSSASCRCGKHAGRAAEAPADAGAAPPGAAVAPARHAGCASGAFCWAAWAPALAFACEPKVGCHRFFAVCWVAAISLGAAADAAAVPVLFPACVYCMQVSGVLTPSMAFAKAIWLTIPILCVHADVL